MPTLPAVIVTLLLPFEPCLTPGPGAKPNSWPWERSCLPANAPCPPPSTSWGLGSTATSPSITTYSTAPNGRLQLSRALLLLVAGRLGSSTEPLVFGIDETVERRWGRKIAAKGRYRDPVRSKDDQVVPTPGLQWVSV